MLPSKPLHYPCSRSSCTVVLPFRHCHILNSNCLQAFFPLLFLLSKWFLWCATQLVKCFKEPLLETANQRLDLKKLLFHKNFQPKLYQKLNNNSVINVNNISRHLLKYYVWHLLLNHLRSLHANCSDRHNSKA